MDPLRVIEEDFPILWDISHGDNRNFILRRRAKENLIRVLRERSGVLYTVQDIRRWTSTLQQRCRRQRFEGDLENCEQWTSGAKPRLKMNATLKKVNLMNIGDGINLPSTSNADDIASMQIPHNKKVQKFAPEASGRRERTLLKKTVVGPETRSDPEPIDDQNTSSSSTHDDQKTTSQAVTVKCCCFCRRDQDVLHFTDMPYVTLNKTTLTINDLRIEVDFNEDTMKTVCKSCDSNLIEIFEFVKVVKEAQDRLSNAEVNASNFNTQNENQSISISDNGFEDDNFNKTNDHQDGVELLYESDSESVTQTVVAHKRKGELKNNDDKKKRRDLVLDPLSLNDTDTLNDTNELIKCKNEIADKEYVNEVITANKVVNVSEDDVTTEIKLEMIETMNDEDQPFQINRVIKTVLSKEPHQAYVINKNSEETEIKEEIVETSNNIHNKVNQHEMRFEMDSVEDLSSICAEKLNELVRKRKVVNETVSSSSEVTESSDSDTVGAMNRSDLVLLVKTIVSEMLNK